jgi:hypothetical protein
MAKKKAGKADQHRSKNMVRLTDDVYQAMKSLAEESDRPLTREIRQALLAWLELKGRPLTRGGDTST